MSSPYLPKGFPGVPPNIINGSSSGISYSPPSRSMSTQFPTQGSQSPNNLHENSAQTPPKKKAKLSPAVQTSEVIDIIPTGPPGDIVIQLNLPISSSADAAKTNTKPTLIRVHSLILTLTSPFFATVLSSSTSGDRKYTQESPLRLPDDIDCPAFLDWVIMVCNQAEHLRNSAAGNIDHNKHDKSKKKQHSYLGRLPRVVALAERLGCAKGMKSWCSMPLWRFFGPRGEADEDGLAEAGLTVLDAIAIAYVVHDGTLFKRATEYALVHYDNEQLDQELGGGLAHILPNGLLDNIKFHRRRTLTTLERALYKPIVSIHQKLLDPDDPEDTPIEPCELASEKLAVYALQLCHLKRGAFSLADAKRGRSLVDVWEGLEAMLEVLPESCKKCGKNCEGGCLVDVRKGVREAVEGSKEGVGGLCLGCVVEGGKSLEKCSVAVDPRLSVIEEEVEAEVGECGHEEMI